MEQDNGWYERGELPPVGVNVEIFNGYGWATCKLICSSKVYVIIEHEGQETPFLKANIRFRKIKTEREKFLERFMQEWRSSLTTREFAADQYDKGLRYTE